MSTYETRGELKVSHSYKEESLPVCLCSRGKQGAHVVRLLVHHRLTDNHRVVCMVVCQPVTDHGLFRISLPLDFS